MTQISHLSTNDTDAYGWNWELFIQGRSLFNADSVWQIGIRNRVPAELKTENVKHIFPIHEQWVAFADELQHEIMMNLCHMPHYELNETE